MISRQWNPKSPYLINIIIIIIIIIISDPIWSYLMFDDDYLWYLIHWMFDEYSGYSSIFGQKPRVPETVSALQELELRCDALEQRKQQLGCPGAENGEPMNQFPKSPEMVPNFHDISTWKRRLDLIKLINAKPENGTLNSRSLRYKLLYEQALRDQSGSQISKISQFVQSEGHAGTPPGYASPVSWLQKNHQYATCHFS